MLRTVTALLVAGLLVAGYAFRNAEPTRAWDELRGRTRTTWTERACAGMDAAAPTGCVVFLGDSHIQQLPVNLIATPAINLGIGQERTDRLLARARGYQSLRTARTVVICSGSSDHILANLKEICALVPTNIPIVFCEIIPSVYPQGGLDAALTAARVNSRMFTDIPRRCRIVSNSTLTSHSWYVDGVHLTADGQRLWAEMIKREVH